MLGLALSGVYKRATAFVPALRASFEDLRPPRAALLRDSLSWSWPTAASSRPSPRFSRSRSARLAIPFNSMVWGSKQTLSRERLVCAGPFAETAHRSALLASYVTLRRSPQQSLRARASSSSHLRRPLPPRAYAPTDLVQEEWKDYAEARSTSDMLWLADQLPAWARSSRASQPQLHYVRRLATTPRRRPLQAHRAERHVAPPPIL